MIEEAKQTPEARAEGSAAEFASSQAMESAARAGAAAIQSLVTECNGLRNRLSVQEAELGRLRGVNAGLRRRFGLLHQRYVELAKKILSQLEQFDGAIREASQVPSSENGHYDEPVVLRPMPQDDNGAGTNQPDRDYVTRALSQTPG